MRMHPVIQCTHGVIWVDCSNYQNSDDCVGWLSPKASNENNENCCAWREVTPHPSLSRSPTRSTTPGDYLPYMYKSSGPSGEHNAIFPVPFDLAGPFHK